MTGDDTPVGQAIAENGQVRISFRRKAAHLGKSGELPERDSVGREFEEQVARDDHLLGAYGHRAAPEDVISAKGGVSGKSRKLADNCDLLDRKSTRLNSSHGYISYAVFCLKKKKTNYKHNQ